MTPLLANTPRPAWRTEFPIEHMQGGSGDPVPSYCAVRTKRYKYVAYDTGEEELYDLATDPYETQNLANTPANEALEASLRTRARALCKPVPPGFRW